MSGRRLVDLCTAQTLVLGFNPWGCDDSPYRVLANGMVVTRFTHECAICFEDIPAGTRVRAQREALEGRAMTFYFCPACCRAMVLVRRARTRRDECAIDVRYDLGRKNADRKRAGRTA
jgi:hypothetical protein